MNASFGDVFNQGRFAIYVTNISEAGVLCRATTSGCRPDGAPDGRCPQYENLAARMGVDLGGWSLGAQFGDLNNDGILDLYLVNGYVSARETDELLVRLLEDRRRPQLRSSATRRTGRRWAAAACPATSGSGSGSTTAPAGSPTWRRWSASTDLYDGRAVALADLSNRGVLDVIVANQRGPLLLYRNTVPPGRALDRLRARGRLPIG